MCALTNTVLIHILSSVYIYIYIYIYITINVHRIGQT